MNYLTALHLLAVLRHVVRPDGLEELDVVVAVVLGHLLQRGFVRSLDHKTNLLDSRFIILLTHQSNTLYLEWLKNDQAICPLRSR